MSECPCGSVTPDIRRPRSPDFQGLSPEFLQNREMLLCLLSGLQTGPLCRGFLRTGQCCLPATSDRAERSQGPGEAAAAGGQWPSGDSEDLNPGLGLPSSQCVCQDRAYCAGIPRWGITAESTARGQRKVGADSTPKGLPAWRPMGLKRNLTLTPEPNTVGGDGGGCPAGACGVRILRLPSP